MYADPSFPQIFKVSLLNICHPPPPPPPHPLGFIEEQGIVGGEKNIPNNTDTHHHRPQASPYNGGGDSVLTGRYELTFANQQ